MEEKKNVRRVSVQRRCGQRKWLRRQRVGRNGDDDCNRLNDEKVAVHLRKAPCTAERDRCNEEQSSRTECNVKKPPFTKTSHPNIIQI